MNTRNTPTLAQTAGKEEGKTFQTPEVSECQQLLMNQHAVYKLVFIAVYRKAGN